MDGIPPRADLLELTPEALMALANPGFVKRALKALADGPLPEMAQAADGTVSADYDDGHRAVLPLGRALREATCTCPASGLCRHRVTLVLAYQRWRSGQAAPAAGKSDEAVASTAAGPWTPAGYSDEDLAAFPVATLEQARRLAAARPAIRVTAWSVEAPVPTARLPMCTVRFFSRTGLMHARCDCSKGNGCEHVVLAVRAFRQTPGLPPGDSAVVELAAHTPGSDARGRWFDADAATPAPDLDALLLQLWLDGSSQAPVALEARFTALRERVQAAGWCWVVDAIDEIQQLLAAQHQRASSFDPLRLLHALAELPARLLAASSAERLAAGGQAPTLPANVILGVGIRGEVALDHLRLVSLGAECWQGEGSQGVRIAFADPDSQGVMVLDRSWSLGSGASGGSVMGRRIVGTSVRQLASGQVVTRGARRRANGLIEIASGVRQTSVLPLGARAWDALDVPLRQPGASALAAYLAQAHPDFVRPRQAIEHLHVLPVARVLGMGWNAVTQALDAQIATQASGEDEIVHLSLPHWPAAPGAVDAMARALAGEWGDAVAVAGPARLEGGRLMMRPLSFLTAQRAVVLDAEQVARQSLPLRETGDPPSAFDRAVGDTLELLASWLRQGLRHVGGSAAARGAKQVEALRQVGLVRAGTQLQQVMAETRGGDRSALPSRLAGLVLLLDGSRRSIRLG